MKNTIFKMQFLFIMSFNSMRLSYLQPIKTSLRSGIFYSFIMIALISCFAISSSANETETNYHHIYIDQSAGKNSPTTTGTAEDPFKSITYAMLLSGKNNVPDPWFVHVKAGVYDANPDKVIQEREIFPLPLREGMIIQGEDGAENCIISGEFTPDSSAAILRGQDLHNITIQGLTLQNMKRTTGNGGAIELINSRTVTLKECVIENNEGSGVWISLDSLGNIVLVENVFKGNKGVTGSGIHIHGKIHAVVYNNSFVSNTASNGGILYILGDIEGDIDNNLFNQNSSSNGSISIFGNLYGNILKNEISNNVSSNDFGAVYIKENLIGEIFNNIINNNSCREYYRVWGGAFSIGGSIIGNITNNQIINNSASVELYSAYGGAFYIGGDIRGSIIDNEIKNNKSSDYGGAFHIVGTVTGNIANNIISDNSAPHGGAFHVSKIINDVNGNEFNNNNSISGRGSAIYIESITGNIHNNLISKCSSDKGTVYINGVISGNINNNRFVENYSNIGNGIFLNDKSESLSAIIYNNLFFEGRTENEELLKSCDIYSNQNIKILNNTFINSRPTSCIYLTANTNNTTIKNNIISGYDTAVWNSGETDIPIINNNIHNITNILYWNNQAMGNDSFFISMLLSNCTDNFDWAPGIIEGVEEFHLAETSENIDAGVEIEVFEDLEGQLRPQGTAFDIGADEFYKGETNEKPTIAITWPSEKGTSAKENLIIQWVDNDPDDNATISLYYDSDQSGFNGTLITEDINEDSTENTYSWNVSDIDPGSYWILAKIDDHRNAPVYAYSQGMVSIAVTPPNPQNLVVESAQNGNVLLHWDHITDPMAVCYQVYRSQTENGVFYPINPYVLDYMHVAYGQVTYMDQDLQENTTYYYKVRSLLGGMESRYFSNIVSATPQSTFMFMTRPISMTKTLVNTGGKVKYDIQLLPKEGFSGTINLSCTNIPKEMVYNFLFNGEDKGVAIHDLALPALIRLEIRTGSATIPAPYDFNLSAQHIWTGGSSPFLNTPLRLTVLPKNESGIQLNLETNQTHLGEPVSIIGNILPPLENRTITLTILSESETLSQTKILTTVSGGIFLDDHILSTLNKGKYYIQASFIDDLSNKHITPVHEFSVLKGRLTITCLKDVSAEPAINEDFTIKGNVMPHLKNSPLELVVIHPDHHISYQETIYTDDDSQFEKTHRFFNKKGIWQIKLYWMGDDQTIGSESNTLMVAVGIDYGRVIILGGGEAGLANMYWQVTKELTVNAYRSLKSMGFSDDMIWFMLNSQNVDINHDDIPDTVVDNELPTVESFQTAIQSQFQETLNADTPLIVYIMGHANSQNQFKILGDDEMISATEMNQAIDAIQKTTQCQVIVIQESCFSGKFISELKGNNRILLTSAGDEPYHTDASGNISFSRYLFSNLRQGNSLSKAFEFAKTMLVNMGYPSPMMDDNADGKYDDQDGEIASTQYIGGQMTWNLIPKIKSVKLPAILEKGITHTEIIVQTAMGDTDITNVWAQIIPPHVKTSDNTVVSYSEVILSPTENPNEYSGTLDQLNQAGTYKIITYALDRNHEISDPKIDYISVFGSSSVTGDFNDNGRLDLMDILDLFRHLMD